MPSDEFVRMNGRRQQSYFHAGFRDALFDLPHPTALPAQNEKRARWYWSGAIHGWARSELWDRITDVYDSNSIVRQLGDGADGASRGAGICIAEALWKTGRAAELHVFVGLALARRPNVHELLLEAGTESLRLRNPGVARSIFEVLLESNESRRAGSPRARDVSTVRRRMAHCLRLLGEHPGAEELLHGLLLEDRNPDIHAMVHADLGLLKGRFSLLDEVRIPGDKTARRDIVDRLKAGKKTLSGRRRGCRRNVRVPRTLLSWRLGACRRWIAGREIPSGRLSFGTCPRSDTEQSCISLIACRAGRSIPGNRQVATVRRRRDSSCRPPNRLGFGGRRHPKPLYRADD